MSASQKQLFEELQGYLEKVWPKEEISKFCEEHGCEKTRSAFIGHFCDFLWPANPSASNGRANY